MRYLSYFSVLESKAAGNLSQVLFELSFAE